MAKKNELENSIGEIFASLDQIRQLPALRLEPLVAPYFTYFLPEILNKKFGLRGSYLSSGIIPEFPLRMRSSNYSEKIDYLAVSKNRRKVLLVELKTDSKSINMNQLEHIKEAEENLNAYIEGVCKLTMASYKGKDNSSAMKYTHLLNRLYGLKLIDVSMDNVINTMFKRGELWKKRCTALGNPKSLLLSSSPDVGVLVIIPNKENHKKVIENEKYKNFRWIDFVDIANIVEEAEGKRELGVIFAKYLRRWAANRAGYLPPN